MNVPGFRSLTVTLLLLGTSLAILAASTSQLAETRSRELSIAIVDGQRGGPERISVQTEMARRMNDAATAAAHGEMRVESWIASAHDARVRLDRGRCDAALVLGPDRPYTLRRLHLATLAGTIPSATGPQPASLLVHTTDPVLRTRLRDAFVRLLTEQDGRSPATGSAAPVQLPPLAHAADPDRAGIAATP